MNKYQEALDYLKNRKDPSKITDSVIALAVIYGNMDEAYETLQELVDKATPKKPVYRIPDISWDKNEKLAHCPTCDWRLDWEQGCHNNKCRQRIDWSEEVLDWSEDE